MLHKKVMQALTRAFNIVPNKHDDDDDWQEIQTHSTEITEIEFVLLMNFL